MTTPRETVAQLLAVAGITVSDAELDTYARLYPGQRASIDAMYEIDAVQGEEPQVVFSPYS